MIDAGYDKVAFIRHLVELAPCFGVSLSDFIIEKLATHFLLLQKWNRSVALTTIVSPSDAARFHYLESLFLAGFIESDIGAVIDIGSGAGFPGLPMAIYYPAIRFVLVEKNHKKAVFLSEAIRALGLTNVTVFHGMYEEYRNRDFDALVCRAIDHLNDQPLSLLQLAIACKSVFFFGNAGFALRLEALVPSIWQITRTRIPLTDNRYVIVLSKQDQNVPRGTT